MENDQTSRAGRISGSVMQCLVVLFMLFDAAMKFMRPQPVIRTTINELGYKDHHIPVHGFTALIPTLLFIIPRTRMLGAVLLTAHFGGAIASHLRVDNPLFTHTLFPVYIAVLMWGSLWLRTERVRNVLPFVKL